MNLSQLAAEKREIMLEYFFSLFPAAVSTFNLSVKARPLRAVRAERPPRPVRPARPPPRSYVEKLRAENER